MVRKSSVPLIGSYGLLMQIIFYLPNGLGNRFVFSPFFRTDIACLRNIVFLE
jgi:hypothetical protein